MRDRVRLAGRVYMVHRRGDRIIGVYEGRNRVVDVGKNLIAEIVAAVAPPAKPSHFAVGSGADAPTDSDIALQTEIWRDPFVGNPVIVANEVTYSGVLTNNEGQPETMAEVGIFNSAGPDTPTMLSRFLTTIVILQALDTIDIDWTLTYG